jgi:predicted lactoylglutathione lyase
MARMIFVNLPVRDLEKSKAFHVALGHTINPKFTDDNAASVVVSDSIYFMLLKHEFFQGFTERKICNTSTHVEVLVALSMDSRAEVDALLARALSAGGREAGSPRDYGFMYQRSFTDPDGHTFEIFYMNEAEFPGAGGGG